MLAERVKCEQCDRIFSSGAFLRRHVEQAHTNGAGAVEANGDRVTVSLSVLFLDRWWEGLSPAAKARVFSRCVEVAGAV